MPDIAMVAALEREVWPLIKDWRTSDHEYAGRQFRFFEKENCVVVCGGIGSAAARRATEAAVAIYKPTAVWSVGFAGALEAQLDVGDFLEFRYVVNAGDGSRVDTGFGVGVLVSFSSIAGNEQKSKLAKAYGALAVDMEAASVARGAQAHGLAFVAIKAISDETGFPMPPLERFTGEDGGFRTGSFVLHTVLRPWLWGTVFRLARNSGKASKALCAHLKARSQSEGQPISRFAVKGSR